MVRLMQYQEIFLLILHQCDHTTTFRESAQSESDDFSVSSDLCRHNLQHRALAVNNFELVARIQILFGERVGRGLRSALPKKNRSLIQSALCS